MKKKNDMDRREFLGKATLAAFEDQPCTERVIGRRLERGYEEDEKDFC
jgi:hypothetical protein